jgi:replication factor C large subunit
MWIHKYRPKDTSGIQGQDSAVAQVKEFVETYAKQKKKAILLYGPSGCAKTVTAHAIAEESGLEVVEINASDYRKPDQIQEKIGNAMGQRSLFAQGKIILIDEVDGISGTKDRGGVPAIAKLIEGSSYPIILTANDPFNKKFTTIRKKSVMVQFHALNYLSVFAVLKRICDKENVVYDEAALKGLARRAGGDLRAAINDLEMVVKDQKLTRAELDLLSERDQEGN